jgi:hypothetical protein
VTPPAVADPPAPQEGVRFFLTAWRSLLDSRLGKAWWQAFAAILPPLIPVSGFFQKNSTEMVRGVTLAGLLLAIALVQLYGRASEQRERIKTAAEREQQKAAAEDRLAKQATLLIDLVVEVRKGRREQRALLIDLVNKIRE